MIAAALAARFPDSLMHVRMKASVKRMINPSLRRPPIQRTSRAEQLLVLEDTDKFIEIAYWVLLKRAPDEEGIANCRGRLQGGASKVQVLYELFTSDECREIGVELPGLRDAFAREGLHVADERVAASPAQLPEAAKSLTELLGYQGGRFVECAYLTLLKRAPDSQGSQDRLKQLLDGVAVWQRFKFWAKWRRRRKRS